MAGTETLLKLAQGVGVLAPIGQGFASRDAAQANAELYRTQGRAALEGAAGDETRFRRQSRQVIAQQVANVAAEGQTDSSAMDVVRQNEVNLIADALALRRRGQIEAAGYESRAALSEYEGEQALYGGIAQAGSKLLMTAAERASLERRARKAADERRARVKV